MESDELWSELRMLKAEVRLLQEPVLPAASGSPSPSESEKPSEQSTCEAGESAEAGSPVMVAAWACGHDWQEFHYCTRCHSKSPLATESAPRKVWAVRPGAGIEVVALFSSRAGAGRYVADSSRGYRITEHEVADD